ncbi:alpha/beta fold hydrolase [Arcticibacter sp.]|uniref:alpha/beta fold hydrolase n=1 Tax=Arcticibacter sp. TaxID=1872630 RepID=UPI00388E0789
MFNHATLRGGEKYYGKIGSLAVKSLIIHGDRDDVCHYRHAPFLARKLKNSYLLTLEGTGHELIPTDWDVIINAFSEANATVLSK